MHLRIPAQRMTAAPVVADQMLRARSPLERRRLPYACPQRVGSRPLSCPLRRSMKLLWYGRVWLPWRCLTHRPAAGPSRKGEIAAVAILPDSRMTDQEALRNIAAIAEWVGEEAPETRQGPGRPGGARSVRPRAGGAGDFGCQRVRVLGGALVASGQVGFDLVPEFGRATHLIGHPKGHRAACRNRLGEEGTRPSQRRSRFQGTQTLHRDDLPHST